MKTHSKFVISAIAASLATLAAAPAMAATPTDIVDIAWDLVDNIQPDNNAWGTPCSIDFDNYTAVSNGACLFTLSLRQADPTITTTVLKAWWGSGNPSSSQFYNAIVSGTHFEEITDVGEILSGDLIAVSWNNGMSGHSMIVLDEPYEVETPFAPVFEETTQWMLGIIDSTTSPHGTLDSRYHAEADGTDDQGVGYGAMRIYTSDETGSIIGYTWSDVVNGSYYPQSTRALTIGRYY